MIEDDTVEAASVSDFLKRYHRRERLYVDDGSFERLLRFHENHFSENGYCIIGRHESVTGEIVCYRGSTK